MSKTENDRLCVGVDLHKTQFTVCAIDEEGEYLLERKYIPLQLVLPRILCKRHNSVE